MMQLFALVALQTPGDAESWGVIGKLLPEGVSVAAVIAVVILFLRRQKESQDEFQAQLRAMQTEQLERDKLFVSAMNRLADKIDELGSSRVNGTARRGA
jgi:hypothetical protein